jgi:hypothetical protein
MPMKQKIDCGFSYAKTLWFSSENRKPVLALSFCGCQDTTTQNDACKLGKHHAAKTKFETCMSLIKGTILPIKKD